MLHQGSGWICGVASSQAEFIFDIAAVFNKPVPILNMGVFFHFPSADVLTGGSNRAATMLTKKKFAGIPTGLGWSDLHF